MYLCIYQRARMNLLDRRDREGGKKAQLFSPLQKSPGFPRPSASLPFLGLRDPPPRIVCIFFPPPVVSSLA